MAQLIGSTHTHNTVYKDIINNWHRLPNRPSYFLAWLAVCLLSTVWHVEMCPDKYSAMLWYLFMWSDSRFKSAVGKDKLYCLSAERENVLWHLFQHLLRTLAMSPIQHRRRKREISRRQDKFRGISTTTARPRPQWLCSSKWTSFVTAAAQFRPDMGTSLNTPTFESMGLAQVHSGITLLNDNNNNNNESDSGTNGMAKSKCTVAHG